MLCIDILRDLGHRWIAAITSPNWYQITLGLGSQYNLWRLGLCRTSGAYARIACPRKAGTSSPALMLRPRSSNWLIDLEVVDERSRLLWPLQPRRRVASTVQNVIVRLDLSERRCPRVVAGG